MRTDSEIRRERGEFLRSLYGAKGEITIRMEPGREVYCRGDAEAPTPSPRDTWAFCRVNTLLRFEEWLRKARVGTLRWLAGQEGMLGAGELHTTAAVRSQLARAELVEPSPFWGDSVTEDGYNLALWATFELDRRGK